jgi:hypothetical protein
MISGLRENSLFPFKRPRASLTDYFAPTASQGLRVKPAYEKANVVKSGVWVYGSIAAKHKIKLARTQLQAGNVTADERGCSRAVARREAQCAPRVGCAQAQGPGTIGSCSHPECLRQNFLPSFRRSVVLPSHPLEEIGERGLHHGVVRMPVRHLAFAITCIRSARECADFRLTLNVSPTILTVAIFGDAIPLFPLNCPRHLFVGHCHPVHAIATPTAHCNS